MTIAAAEDWLVAVIKDAVGSAVTVTNGPHEWDGSFVKNLITSLPAVVTWYLDGGTAAVGTSLTLDAHLDALRRPRLEGRRSGVAAAAGDHGRLRDPPGAPCPPAQHEYGWSGSTARRARAQRCRTSPT